MYSLVKDTFKHFKSLFDSWKVLYFMDPDCFVDPQVDTNDYTIRSLKQTHALITHVSFDRILFLFVDDPVSSSFFSSTERLSTCSNQLVISVLPSSYKCCIWSFLLWRTQILGDEMGLGKTIEVLVFLSYLSKKHHLHGVHLIVAPSSMIHRWKQEIEEWCPTLHCEMYNEEIYFKWVDIMEKRKRTWWKTWNNIKWISSSQGMIGFNRE